MTQQEGNYEVTLAALKFLEKVENAIELILVWTLRHNVIEQPEHARIGREPECV